jgi:hypothetical protein
MKKPTRKQVRKPARKRTRKPVPKPVKKVLTPRQLLLKRFGDQTQIAEAANCTRQAVSIAFKRGKLSFQMASMLSKRMGIPVKRLLLEWIPDTNRRAKQSPYAKRRLAALEAQPRA